MAINFGIFSPAGAQPDEQGPELHPPTRQERAGSFIGAGVRLAGALRSGQELTVQGRIEGPVMTEGDVLVERGGLVEGDIRAASIRVRGRTQGALVGTAQITLEPGAEHHGRVTTPSLIVQAGATVDGEVKAGAGADLSRAQLPSKPSG